MNKESSQNIIEKLIEKYASIRFYQDNGVIIQSEFIDEFCTYFKSPSQLAVEFSNARRNSDHGFSKLLLSDSRLLYKQFPGNVFTEVDSYPSPLNYHFVLGLLLKEIHCGTIESLQSKGDQEYLFHNFLKSRTIQIMLFCTSLEILNCCDFYQIICP